MLEHHIQKQIVYKLAFSEGLKFSELKPEGIENKLFDYHLKIVIRDGFVAKNDEGLYQLTAEGRRLGSRAFLKQLSVADRAESILILAIRRKSDGAWLLYKRLTHPLLDKTGFMHVTPSAGKSAINMAKDWVKLKTGLELDFKTLGAGFITTYKDDELEGFVNYNMLVCDDAEGEITQKDENAEYYWDENPDFNSPYMIPNMKMLSDLYLKGELFYEELVVKL